MKGRQPPLICAWWWMIGLVQERQQNSGCSNRESKYIHFVVIVQTNSPVDIASEVKTEGLRQIREAVEV